MKKYNFKTESLYYLFNDNVDYHYNKNLVNAIFMSFKDEEKEDLIKQYGSNLTSGSIPHLKLDIIHSYAISNILCIFHIRLYLSNIMLKNNSTFEDITNHFLNEDLSRERITTNNNLITNYEVLVRKFNCSDEELSDALELVEDRNFRSIIRYTYGINSKVWDKKVICEVLKIDEDFYESIIIYFLCILDSLIKTVRNDLEESITGNKSKNLIIIKKDNV